jgi:hypothetical protein
MTLPEFNAAIRNKTVKSLGGGNFYKGFDETINGYIPAYKSYGLKNDYDALQNPDCRRDMGYDYSADDKLSIQVDWGGTINSMTVVQGQASSFDCINEFWVLSPQKTTQLANKFINYYKYHRHKVIDFRYDPSGNNEDPRYVLTNAEEFTQLLRKAGWEVNMLSIGKRNVAHAKKHEVWKAILNVNNGKCIDTRFKPFKFNTLRCDCLPVSMGNAALKIGSKGWEKDKSSERKGSKVPPQLATHLSDTIDLFVFDRYGQILYPSTSGYGSAM